MEIPRPSSSIPYIYLVLIFANLPVGMQIGILILFPLMFNLGWDISLMSFIFFADILLSPVFSSSHFAVLLRVKNLLWIASPLAVFMSPSILSFRFCLNMLAKSVGYWFVGFLVNKEASPDKGWDAFKFIFFFVSYLLSSLLFTRFSKSYCCLAVFAFENLSLFLNFFFSDFGLKISITGSIFASLLVSSLWMEF